MKRTGPSNPNTQALIQILKKADQPNIWRRVAELINAPLRKRRVINVDQLNHIVNDGEIVVIPTKVLGSGVIDKKIIVGALHFSNEARRKIISAGGTPLSIIELWEKHPKGTNVRLLR
jgi:large subunit ribosomal protein L18e